MISNFVLDNQTYRIQKQLDRRLYDTLSCDIKRCNSATKWIIWTKFMTAIKQKVQVFYDSFRFSFFFFLDQWFNTDNCHYKCSETPLVWLQFYQNKQKRYRYIYPILNVQYSIVYSCFDLYGFFSIINFLKGLEF